MRYFTLTKVLFLLSISFSLVSNVSAQSDGELFAEGRIAFEKHKDCPAALKTLKGVSQAGQNNPLFIYIYAQVNECVGNLQEALTYYEKYNLLIPGQGELIEKIGDLRYKVRKEKEEAEMSTKRLTELKWVSVTSNLAGTTLVEQVCRVISSNGVYFGNYNPTIGCVAPIDYEIGVLESRNYDFLSTESKTAGKGRWETFDVKNKDIILSKAYVAGERKGKKIYLCKDYYVGWFDAETLTCFNLDLQKNYEDKYQFYLSKKTTGFSIFIP